VNQIISIFFRFVYVWIFWVLSIHRKKYRVLKWSVQVIRISRCSFFLDLKKVCDFPDSYNYAEDFQIRIDKQVLKENRNWKADVSISCSPIGRISIPPATVYNIYILIPSATVYPSLVIRKYIFFKLQSYRIYFMIYKIIIIIKLFKTKTYSLNCIK